MPRRKLTEDEKNAKPHKVQFLPGRLRKLPNQFDVTTASMILKIPIYTIYNWIKNRELPAVEVPNGPMQISKREFVGWAVIKKHLQRKYLTEVF